MLLLLLLGVALLCLDAGCAHAYSVVECGWIGQRFKRVVAVIVQFIAAVCGAVRVGCML